MEMDCREEKVIIKGWKACKCCWTQVDLDKIHDNAWFLPDHNSTLIICSTRECSEKSTNRRLTMGLSFIQLYLERRHKAYHLQPWLLSQSTLPPSSANQSLLTWIHLLVACSCPMLLLISLYQLSPLYSNRLSSNPKCLSISLRRHCLTRCFPSKVCFYLI